MKLNEPAVYFHTALLLGSFLAFGMRVTGWVLLVLALACAFKVLFDGRPHA